MNDVVITVGISSSKLAIVATTVDVVPIEGLGKVVITLSLRKQASQMSFLLVSNHSSFWLVDPSHTLFYQNANAYASKPPFVIQIV